MSDQPLKHSDHEARKPWFGGLALALALIGSTLSFSLYFSGRGVGFEGFGAMLVGVAIGVVGVICVLVPALISMARKEEPAWMPFLSIAIAVLAIILLLAAD